MEPVADVSVTEERSSILNSCTDDILFVKLWHSYPKTSIGWTKLFAVYDEKENPLNPQVKWVVRDLTFGVKRGEVLGVIGENGAGKSTAIASLLGVVQAVGGYSGVTPGRRIGFCPQVNALWDKLSGIEHVRFYCNVCGCWKGYADAEKRMASVGLEPDSFYKQTRQYSGGMKRRLCLAIALIGDPSVLILDEPSAGVDIAGKREIWNILKSLCSRDCSVLITTHSLEEADNLSNRICIMNKGSLVKVGTTNELKKQQDKLFVTVQETDGNGGVEAVLRAEIGNDKVRTVDAESHKYEVSLTGVRMSQLVGVLVKLKREKRISDFTMSQLSLEDVFLNTIGGGTAVE